MREAKTIPDSLDGQRLDCVLRGLWPDLSLRAARRLIADGNALLDGKIAAASRKVRKGGEVAVWQAENPALPVAGACLLAIHGGFYFFYKPRGMHSVALAGRNNVSLESLAPGILAGRGIVADVRLLQRLDFGTGGIITGAGTEAAAVWYRDAEKRGLCKKYYYAALCGYLERSIYAKNALDCASRRAVRPLREEAGPLGWTLFEPVAYAGGLTLARCMIRIGARHQIRVHAAAIGHSLAGDPLYGVSDGNGFMLEHFHLKFPGYDLVYLDKNSRIRQFFSDQLLDIPGERQLCAL